MPKKLRDTNFEEFYKINEFVAKTTPMRVHYCSSNPGERWLWKQKKKRIKDLIKTLPIKNLIDLGCGDCGMLEVIPKKINYMGIDISPTQISYAKKIILESGKTNAQVRLGDILNTNLKENTYDTALLCDIVEHVLDPEKLFEEVKRVVKKNGYIIISIPNEDMWKTTRAFLLRFPLHSPDHIYAIERSDIKKNFKQIDKEIYIPIQFAPKLSLIQIFVIKNVK